MPNYSTYKKLELPISNERYNVAVANKNNAIIDSELHKLEQKNLSQDYLLATKEELLTHVNDKSNPHEVTKAQVGLGNVENKSSAVIRGELTQNNVTAALGYKPYTPEEVQGQLSLLETKLEHENKTVLDGITPESVANWNFAHEYSISDHTPGIVTSESDGLCPKLAGTGQKYLRDDGTWETPKGGESQDIPVNIPASGWEGAAAPYSQTLTLSQIREGMTPLYLLDASALTPENLDYLQYAYSLLTGYTPGNAQITFHAADLPDRDIPVLLKGI